MSILDEDIYDDGRASFEELLAKGEYESNTETIMKGFKLFQKKYVYKSIALQLMLVVLAVASQLLNIFYAAEGDDVSFSYMLVIMCAVLAVYILIRPKNSSRKLEESIKELSGTVYQAEIYTNKIIITTLYDAYKSDDEEENNVEDEENPEDASAEDNGPPATIIHLDNGGVEIVESDDIFVVYIKKLNMYVIPKSAFKPYELEEIKNRLSNIMGVRYKS